VVECPSGSGILENFADTIPTVGDDGAAYWSSSTSTTTTAA